MNLQNYPSEIDIDIQEMRSIFLNVAINQIELKLGNENANQIFSWWQQVFSNNGFFEKITLQEILFRTFGTIICVAIILSTLIGNILVIVVVTRFHRMRTVTNILLARYFINGFINDLINFC